MNKIYAGIVGIAVFLGGCGEAPEQLDTSASAISIPGVYHGSYMCGPDWWHFEQPITLTTPYLTMAIPPNDLHTSYADSNEVQIKCWGSPAPAAWGGYSYYNTTSISGSPSQCAMYAHRRNQPWAFSAFVDISGSGLQMYPGSPPIWVLGAWQASLGGTLDGLSGCGGHILVTLQ